MIWRIRDRAGFERLRTHGRRTRAGVLWCTYVLDPASSPPQVAFAFSRALGPAVLRNRLRRQVRESLRTMTVPAGLFLIGAQPTVASRSSDELVRDLHTMFSRLDV